MKREIACMLFLLVLIAGCIAPPEAPAEEEPMEEAPAEAVAAPGEETGVQGEITAELCAQAEKEKFRELCNAVVAKDMEMCNEVDDFYYWEDCRELVALAAMDPHMCFDTSNPFTCIGDIIAQTGDISICDEIDAGGCYLWKAYETRDITLCFEANKKQKTMYTFPLCKALVYVDASKCEEVGFGNATCYYRYALMTHDSSACAHAGMHTGDCYSIIDGNWSACGESQTGVDYCYSHFLREHYGDEACADAGKVNCGYYEAISERDFGKCEDDSCRLSVMQALLRGYASTWYYRR